MTPPPSSAHGHRLLQIGMALFLGALFIGVALPRFAVPRLALSAHLLGLMQGLFLMVVAHFWERLRLSPTVLRVTFWLAVYGSLAPLTANLLAAAWGAGNTLLPIAAGQAHGSVFQERVIVTLLRTGGAVLIAVSGLILWGLRLPERVNQASD